jgi:hypothetical protein
MVGSAWAGHQLLAPIAIRRCNLVERSGDPSAAPRDRARWLPDAPGFSNDLPAPPCTVGHRRHREQSQSSRPWSAVQADRLVRRRAFCISSSANTRSHTPENMVNGRYQKRMGMAGPCCKTEPRRITRAQRTVSRYYSPHGIHLRFSVALAAGPFLNWGWPPSSIWPAHRRVALTPPKNIRPECSWWPSSMGQTVRSGHSSCCAYAVPMYRTAAPFRSKAVRFFPFRV